MTETLVWEDYLTVGLYFAVVLAVGLWVTCFSRASHIMILIHSELTLVRLNILPTFYPVNMQYSRYTFVYTGRVENCVDPDQMDLVF